MRSAYKILAGNLKGRDNLGGMISDTVGPVRSGPVRSLAVVSVTEPILQYNCGKERKGKERKAKQSKAKQSKAKQQHISRSWPVNEMSAHIYVPSFETMINLYRKIIT
jgi:sortase (surface protein transpeptidase)